MPSLKPSFMNFHTCSHLYIESLAPALLVHGSFNGGSLKQEAKEDDYKIDLEFNIQIIHKFNNCHLCIVTCPVWDV